MTEYEKYAGYLTDSPDRAKDDFYQTDGRVGYWSVSGWQKNSSAMTVNNIGTMVFADENSCDAAISVPERGVYAVFDGVSQDGNKAARKAARFAAMQVAMRSLKRSIVNAEELADIVESTDTVMVNSKKWPECSDDYSRNLGHTTASVVKILSEEPYGFRIAYAHVGDSRIYHVTDAGVRQITIDEVDDTGGLNNIMGFFPPREKRTVRQFGVLSVRTGDYVVIVTDGITKGWLGLCLDGEDLADIVRESDNVLVAAKSLIAESLSSDDSTAIVLKF